MLAYAAIMFAVAWAIDRYGMPHRVARIAYPLSLAVYCSSWTFFGGVGTAASGGWDYLSIYLGPVLVFLLAPGFLRRMIRLARAEGSSSIADFISARYGRSRSIAAIVTVAALLASIPYIALQLRSVTLSFQALVGADATPFAGVSIAVLLAGFAIVFGARRYEVAGRNEGVVGAIAAESLIKLACFVMLGVFGVALIVGLPEDTRAAEIVRFGERLRFGSISGDFLVKTLLSATAILCLPRQFYVGVVEADGSDPVKIARWPFIAYLVVISAMMLPLALAATALMPPSAPPDLYVLTLPLSQGRQTIALLAFLGGFSAATAMVVAETIALSTMASNDLLAPLLLRRRPTGSEGDLGRLMLAARRGIIVVIVMVALAYSTFLGAEWTLASIGLIAFAGVAQFAPALVATVSFNFCNAPAARSGLIGGLLVWAYCLLLPSISETFATGLAFATSGLLDPHALFGVRLGSPLVSGTLSSLGINILLMTVVHARTSNSGHNVIDHVGTMGELQTLVGRFVGEGEAMESLSRLTVGPNQRGDPTAPIDGHAARQAERLIAGVVGAPSARLIVSSSLAGSALEISDVVRLLDQRGSSLNFSRSLLSATLETIDPGVSVIDENNRLIAWNPRYVDMFNYPAGYLVTGRPIADLIRYNALRGECGPGEADAHVDRRLAHLRRGQPHSFERQHPDGRWIKTVGRAMPGGGYVQSFTDITTEREAQANLEERVEERTQDLARSNRLLEEARAAAEAATRDKTHFLATASHDLLQPLHAARLFCAALADSGATDLGLIRAIDGAITSADTLLRALLDVSRLDAGGVTPRLESFALDELIEEVVRDILPLANERGLTVHSHPGGHVVTTDRSLLRSILQNFLSNAVRYTAQGRIWIGARRRGTGVSIDVRDSGPGIAEADQERIFGEFERLESKGSAGGGVGLGLAIVRRTARLLDLPITLRSRPGRGSVFSVLVPHRSPADRYEPPRLVTKAPSFLSAGLRVLCIDNEPAVLAAMDAALRSRGCVPLLARTENEALAFSEAEEPDAALIDLHLAEGKSGLDLAQCLAATTPRPAIAIITADRSVVDDPRCVSLRLTILTKPVDPEDLWRFLASASAAAEAAE